MAISLRRCVDASDPDWLALRLSLWPAASNEHRAEMALFCAAPERFAQFIAREDDVAVGLVEVALRSDYVNGTDSSPVAFLEGILVRPEFRRRGIARALVVEAETWAMGHGCAEFASDAAIENAASQDLHRALGFAETERVVFFRKALAERTSD